MIFALLFFFSFVVGLIVYMATDKWWLGGAVLVGLLVIVALTDLEQMYLLYFGAPIAFLGSLFGAYIVQLRRAPELEPDLEQEADAQFNPETNEQERASNQGDR